MSVQMNVLFLPKWYPCRNDALQGLFVQRHAEAVSKYCNITVLYVVVDPQLKGKLLEYKITSEKNINVIRVYYKGKITGIVLIDKLIKLFLYFFGVFSGYRICNKKFGKFSLIHVHVLLRTVFLPLYLKLFKKYKYLISEHWTGYLPINGTYKKMSFLKKALYKIGVQNSAVVCPDSADLGNWMRNWGLTSTYIPVSNVVDTDLFQNYTLEKKDKKRIIHLSSLKEEHKNVSGLIRVIEKVWKVRQDFELFIIGDEFDYNMLKNKVQEQKLEQVIFFSGRKVNYELANLLSSGDFFVLFSNYENQPCVINEALACSLPILATNVGGISEVVTSEVGRLVNPGDEQELYKEIIFFLDNADKYDKKFLRDYAVNNFSVEKIGYKLFEIYNSIISNKYDRN